MKTYSILILLIISYGYVHSKRILYNSQIDPNIVTSKVLNSYPGALKEEEFTKQLYDILHGYNKLFGEHTLLATSFCCDEINRDLENSIASLFGKSSFSMGGLSGFPFGGITSFCAFAHHIPEEGTALIVFGPHIGVDENGIIGQVNRRGHSYSSSCCGSAFAAINSDENLHNPLDIQQNYVNKIVKNYDNIEHHNLPHILLEVQTNMIINIITQSIKLYNPIPQDTPIAIVGGIHINTPKGISDFFLPKIFQLRSSNGKIIKEFI